MPTSSSQYGFLRENSAARPCADLFCLALSLPPPAFAPRGGRWPLTGWIAFSRLRAWAVSSPLELAMTTQSANLALPPMKPTLYPFRRWEAYAWVAWGLAGAYFVQVTGRLADKQLVTWQLLVLST